MDQRRNRGHTVVKAASRARNDVFVYMEGGGDSDALKVELRQGMATWLGKYPALRGKLPRVVACGGREQAFDQFKTALAQGKNALLLVDSEACVDLSHQALPEERWLPWSHLKQQAGWTQPDAAGQQDAHLMVVCMESWFLAEPQVLATFFGAGFRELQLPHAGIEQQAKERVYQALKQASKHSAKGEYGKGSHSFKLLGLLDPVKVAAASPWAKRFLDELVKRKS